MRQTSLEDFSSLCIILIFTVIAYGSYIYIKVHVAARMLVQFYNYYIIICYTCTIIRFNILELK